MALCLPSVRTGPPCMIHLQHVHPHNPRHVTRLLAFAREILAICHTLEITPILSGSLAVFAYTQDSTLCVNDLDLACSESDFPRLGRALESHGTTVVYKPWHVLQARRDELKIEFDAVEYWMADLPVEVETLRVAGCTFEMVSLPALRELYKRGLDATVASQGPGDRAKHAAIARKYAALCAVDSHMST